MKFKIVFSVLVGVMFLFGFLVVLAGGWDNFKLHSTQYWGYFTVGNNPLFSGFDRDLESFESSEIEPRIESSQLRSGGPPKDGIPSIDVPRFESVDETSFNDEEMIIGVYYEGEARAYPYGIMNWHEIVNDDFSGTPVVVTYCPLCDTNPVFIGEVNGETRTFGVSGKLFHSCLVMFDRETDSLWSQPWGLGVAGEHTNEELDRIPAERTTFGEWKEKYPETIVLSTETGHNRDYFRYPYGSYFTDSNLIFPARNQDMLEYHPKEIVSYIWDLDNQTPVNEFSGESHQFVHEEIREIGEIEVEFRRNLVVARWDEDLETVRVFDNEEEIPSSSAFAFVYAAYFK